MILLQPATSPGKRAAIVLAVAVHLLLAAVLFYGIRWQTRPAAPVEVEIVRAQAPAAQSVAEAKVEPPLEVKPEPLPEVKPEPLPEVKAPPKPDIAYKDKDKPKPKEAKAPEPKPLKEPAPKSQYDPLRRQLDEELKQTAARKSAEAITRQQTQLKAAASAAAQKAAAKAWIDQIASRIKHNIMRPGNVSGNPQAVFIILLLPDGSLIGEPKMQQSTGNAALDAAIERAIKKSDPLPKPADPSVFEREVKLTFRPLEE